MSDGIHRRRALGQAPQTRRRSTSATVIRAGLALVSTAVVAVTGAGWWSVNLAMGDFTVSRALSSLRTGPAPKRDEAINVLLIGLDSRKDRHGNDLPQDLLDKLHAGDSDDGGYNTNTLILAHIDADDHVTAFSIPRDDYVDAEGIVPGYGQIKIKEAYGLTKAAAEQNLVDQGVVDQETLEAQGREAGRTATLKVVRNLTGVPIDYFAEVNLAGFYDLAASLDGVQVCLNSPVSDEYSGADFPAGLQTLNAQQALEFVRQRHGLHNGDLDRTHRQQAFLVAVLRQLQDAGTLTDFGKLRNLMAVAQKDVVLSTGWGEEQFRRIAALAGGNVKFQTLPVVRYDNVDGQDVNIIDPAAIKAQVMSAFEGDLPLIASAPTSTVDVVNAGSTPGLAATVSETLRNKGFHVGEVRNGTADESTGTSIKVGTGSEADAQSLATLLGFDGQPQPDAAVSTGHLQVTLGEGYALPVGLGDAAAASSSSDTPVAGQAINGGQVPCVD